MIVIIKYNAGNIKSVENAINSLGYECQITDDTSIIESADKVIFPGVGEASTTMRYLKSSGLDEVIKQLTQPVLGICLGLQLMCKHSEEGNTDCLGIFDINVKQFPPKDIVPHMGWNNHKNVSNDIFNKIESNDDFYFVHSYYAELSCDTIATCNYILPFSSALKKDNFYATQFHPEKSGEIGKQLLKNFLEL